MLNQLKKYNQTKIIELYEQASEADKKAILESLNTIDLESIMKIYQNDNKAISYSSLNNDVSITTGQLQVFALLHKRAVDQLK